MLFNGTRWSLVFVTACHSLWGARNEFIFEGKRIEIAGFPYMISRLASDYTLALNAADYATKRLKTHKEVMISWSPPSEGWYSLNSDG